MGPQLFATVRGLWREVLLALGDQANLRHSLDTLHSRVHAVACWLGHDPGLKPTLLGALTSAYGQVATLEATILALLDRLDLAPGHVWS